MVSRVKTKGFAGLGAPGNGDADEVVPFKQGQQLYDAAPGPKRLITVRGGRHNAEQPEEYRQALDEFLAQLPPVGVPVVKTASIDVH